MFFNKINRSIDLLYSAVSPIYSGYQHFNGIPPGFWRDEYVQGFTIAFISFPVHHVLPVKLSEPQALKVMAGVVERLSNMNGSRLVEEMFERAAVAEQLSDIESEDKFTSGYNHGLGLAIYNVGYDTKVFPDFFNLEEPEAPDDPAVLSSVLTNFVWKLFPAFDTQ